MLKDVILMMIRGDWWNSPSNATVAMEHPLSMEFIFCWGNHWTQGEQLKNMRIEPTIEGISIHQQYYIIDSNQPEYLRTSTNKNREGH